MFGGLREAIGFSLPAKQVRRIRREKASPQRSAVAPIAGSAPARFVGKPSSRLPSLEGMRKVLQLRASSASSPSRISASTLHVAGSRVNASAAVSGKRTIGNAQAQRLAGISHDPADPFP